MALPQRPEKSASAPSRHPSWFPALLVLLALIAAACSSGSDSAATEPGAGATEPGSTASSDDGDGDGGSDQPGTTAAHGGERDCVAPQLEGDAPGGDTVTQISSTPIEDVPSAISNATDDAFPAPLVDLDRILSGGPPPDGIPPIDDPKFVSVDDAIFVAPCEAVLALELDGQARAYPIQIMTWHEIVNDTIADTPVTVTYCPLCNSGVAYDRRSGDRILDFGTSGRLYQSALVMYDRQTESLWSHFTGQAIVGHLTGTELDVIPVQTLSMASFVEAFPDGLVLSLDTGFDRRYGANPYEGYDLEGSPAFLFDGEAPSDFDEKTRVIGVERNGESVAVLQEPLFASGVVEFTLGGDELIAWIEPGLVSPLQSGRVDDGRDVGSSAVFVPVVDGQRLNFSRTADGFVDAETGSTWNVLGKAISGELEGAQLERVAAVDTFWFSWTAFHPETTVVEG